MSMDVLTSNLVDSLARIDDLTKELYKKRSLEQSQANIIPENVNLFNSVTIDNDFCNCYQYLQAVGASFVCQREKNKAIVYVSSGEGTTSQGDFHESLNLASTWNLPVIFCIENNGYGLSTPVNQQYAIEDLADRAAGYNMDSYVIDGNNVVDVYNCLMEVSEKMRFDNKPVLIEFKTFRMKGHEEASGQAYVDPQIIEEWAKKDPIKNFEEFLIKSKHLNSKTLKVIKNDLDKEIDLNWNKAKSYNETQFDENLELNDVYRDFIPSNNHLDSSINGEVRFVDAIKKGIDESMSKYDNLVLSLIHI